MTQNPSSSTESTPSPTGRSSRRHVGTDIALIAGFAAFLAVCAQFALPFGVNGVPFSLQPLAVLLTGAVLGSRRGALAVLLYLAIGAIGFPVFANGTGGLGPFSGPTVGYLISFPIAAFIIGFAVERAGVRQRPAAILVGGLLAVATTWLIGAAGVAAVVGTAYGPTLKATAVYLPGDLLKLAVAGVIAVAVHRAFPLLLDRR